MTLRGVVLDVDGTVLRGEQPLPGAAAGLDAVAAAGLRRLFVSNNPTKAPDAYEGRFERAGFAVDVDEVLTAGTVTVSYLREEHADDHVYVVGEDGLRTQLREAGLTLVTDPDRAGVVVVSIDRTFDYDTLCTAMRALADPDVRFVGTDPDMVIPTADGDRPGSGAVINAVAGPARRDPDAMLGKPSPPARRLILDRLGVDPGECLVVGDRLDTDIALGAAAGMTTALVLTGVTDRADLAASSYDPDYVLEDLSELEGVFHAG